MSGWFTRMGPLLRGDLRKILESSADGVPRSLSLAFDILPASEELAGAIRALHIPEVASIEAADLFRGKNVPEGKYSLMIRVTFQSREATLTDAQVAAFSGKILAALEALGATLRTS